MIAVIDYGAGNLRSVKNALAYLGEQAEITGDKDTILAADKVILPGVGAFGEAMASLEKKGLDGVIREVIAAEKPFLGICLGLQLLFEESDESPGVRGLGVFRGRVVRIPDRGLKIPHMGWNDITLAKESRILTGNPFVYFVHSYYVTTPDTEIVSAYAEYGERLAVAVERGSVFAVQFHPEKSGEAGMAILKRFAEM